MSNYIPLLSQNKQFEFPNQYIVDEMDLIDLRRKIMKWCAKSQGAISPCRACPNKCSAGIRALALYDGVEVPKTSEPEVAKPTIKEEKKEPVEIKKEVIEMKKEDKKRGRPVSKWYEDAVASGDPVKWCMDNLGLTIQKAKKRIYMYEYNRFGTRRSKDETKVETGPIVKVASEHVVKADNDMSLISAMETEMKNLEAKQQEYKTRIDELTSEYNKISNKLEAISMCIEQYRSIV